MLLLYRQQGTEGDHLRVLSSDRLLISFVGYHGKRLPLSVVWFHPTSRAPCWLGLLVEGLLEMRRRGALRCCCSAAVAARVSVNKMPARKRHRCNSEREAGCHLLKTRPRRHIRVQKQGGHYSPVFKSCLLHFISSTLKTPSLSFPACKNSFPAPPY